MKREQRKRLATANGMPDEVHGQGHGAEWRMMRWWNHWTAPLEAEDGARVAKREVARRGRLVSALMLLQLLTLVCALPTAVLINPEGKLLFIFVFVILFCVSCCALFVNRQGKTLAAAFMVVVTFELAVVLLMLEAMTLDVANLTLLDLLIGGVTLAVFLLPGPAVLVVALFNCFFIWVDLTIQPHTEALGRMLASNGLEVYLRPIGLEIFLSVVMYLAMRGITQVLERADSSELIAQLEHTLAEQQRDMEKEKNQLEAGVQLLVNAQAEAANGNTSMRVPLLEAKALWPLAGSLNTLLTRMRRLYQVERDLQQTYRAATYIVHVMREAWVRQQPLRFSRTGTMLDPLLLELNNRAIVIAQPVTPMRKPIPVPQELVAEPSAVFEHSPSLQQWVSEMQKARQPAHQGSQAHNGHV